MSGRRLGALYTACLIVGCAADPDRQGPVRGACTDALDEVSIVPISGGTLIVLHDGLTAVAADPEHDRVVVVDLAATSVSSTIALGAGDEPGRLVEDGAGRVHVALRGGGALLTIDP